MGVIKNQGHIEPRAQAGSGHETRREKASCPDPALTRREKGLVTIELVVLSQQSYF